MDKNELTKIILGDSSWAFLRFLITISSIGMIIGGFILILLKTSGGGIIDVKTAFVEGKLESGSVGLLFSFLGVFLLISCITSKVSSRLKITKGKNGLLTIEHKGVFGDKKAKAIATVLKTDATEKEEERQKVDEQER